MAALKLTLEDGREFEYGETIEWINDKNEWIRLRVGTYSDEENISFYHIVTNAKRVRKLHARKTVDLTNDDVLDMLRKGGYEWKMKSNSMWYGNHGYVIYPDGRITISGCGIDNFTAYRHVSDLIEHPMTKGVEG